MRLTVLAVLAALVLETVTATHYAEHEARDEIHRIVRRHHSNIQYHLSSSSGSTCTNENRSLRREFSALSIEERREYIDALLCMQSRPALTPRSVAPGVRTRWDDFVYTHISQSTTIHFTGLFFAWHRYFTWSFEQAIRSECGYTGHQPYWDWSKYVGNLQGSPMFNGDENSLSGAGAFVPHNGTYFSIGAKETFYVPPGIGGGCVVDGPFKDMTVHLGPSLLPGFPKGPDDGLGYNPRCLKRDLNPDFYDGIFNYTNVYKLLTGPKNIEEFQDKAQGVGVGTFGVHGGGHIAIGGDPSGDFFANPGDPAFYIHHGMMDRIWWIWQNLDRTREMTIAGPGYFQGLEPAPTPTLDTTFDMGWAMPYNSTVRVRDVVSSIDGPFCYGYA